MNETSGTSRFEENFEHRHQDRKDGKDIQQLDYTHRDIYIMHI